MKYIGVKLVEAEACPVWKDFWERKAGEKGYEVFYVDDDGSRSQRNIPQVGYLALPGDMKDMPKAEIRKLEFLLGTLINGFRGEK